MRSDWLKRIMTVGLSLLMTATMAIPAVTLRAAETTAAAEETKAVVETTAAGEASKAVVETTAAGEAAAADESAVEETTVEVPEDATKLYTTDTMNFRAGAGTDFDVIGQVPQFSEVALLETEGSWVKIIFEGQVGYISGNYVADSMEAAQQAAEEAAKKEEEEEKSDGGSSKKSSKKSKKSKKKKKKIVSKKKVYDCDGSGHGYWIIIYDDGSKEIIPF